ncbi:uncharacterized protein LOC120794467 [Xiphias gladius]|uniref:uncharacterized protein LOC120794467 n=1 Tax=Xiphias gladius TaxID=8245 RepID=UPI001A99D63E|nr:uncharacterized protein LOC120794467 [Xiphias gladius]
MMKAHWWSCVLGLLCMPAVVILNPWTVSQNPLSISLMRVNSSAEITCSTSLSEPMGLYLNRRFHGEGDIVYLALQNRLVTKNTTSAKFIGRIHVTPSYGPSYGFTLRLSLLALDDTDLYYCTWSHFKPQTATRETQSSNGTIIIVREKEPQEQCKDHIEGLIMISFSVTAVVLFLFTGALILILRRKRFKRHFRPARAIKSTRYISPQHVCPQHRIQHCAYLNPSANTLDFRGIL